MAAEAYNGHSEWMKGKGPQGDVIMSTRARLARNLKDYKFPAGADKEELIAIRKEIGATLSDTKYNFKLIHLEDFSELERRALVERHLISMGHAQGGPGKMLAVDEKEEISIMVNEEDHLRIQVLFPGLRLQEALHIVDELDDLLEDNLNYAFRENFGYLTSCPTNVGTGLRASVMAHLPGLKLAGALGQTLNLVSRLGLAVRGLYGEGSGSSGNIFQLSNQVSLGVSEQDIIKNMLGIINQVVDRERQARQGILQENESEIKDRIFRSYGLLANAYKMTSKEAMDLLSDLKLGIELDLIKNVDKGILNQLMVLTRPATLQRMAGEELEPVRRDIERAELIRQKILGGEINVR